MAKTTHSSRTEQPVTDQYGGAHSAPMLKLVEKT